MGLPEKGLVLSWLLFLLGLFGVLVRRDLIFMLMSLEIMLNAAGLAFVSAGASRGDPGGQVMFIFILALAAAEVSIGLALVLKLFGKTRTLDSDAASRLRG
jgi:NADH-quinone oxidoreductase subunit K